MRLCRRCDAIIAEFDDECPRCGGEFTIPVGKISVSQHVKSFFEDVIAWIDVPAWMTSRAEKRGLTRISPAAAVKRETSCLSPLSRRLTLLRFSLAALGALLFAAGAWAPIIRISSQGTYNLLRMTDFLAVLGKAAQLEGPVFIIAYLGNAALIIAALAFLSALLRWNKGVANAASFSSYVVVIVVGGYFMSLRRIGPELSRALEKVLNLQSFTVEISPIYTGVILLLLGMLCLNIAHYWQVYRWGEE